MKAYLICNIDITGSYHTRKYCVSCSKVVLKEYRRIINYKKRLNKNCISCGIELGYWQHKYCKACAERIRRGNKLSIGYKFIERRDFVNVG